MAESRVNNYLLMPDSFKGTIDAVTVCDIMSSAITKKNPEANIKCIPLADGGEGTVDCFIKALGGEKRFMEVEGPYGEKQEGFYGWFGDFAVVEMAAAAGFAAAGDRRDPSVATTFGVGQLIKRAIEDGCRKIILGLGGSCTNDGGAGMAAALGAVFTDKEGRKFIPVGRTLNRIDAIDTARLAANIQGISVEIMCDIDNELCGADGAAYVFAGQKGADREMIKMLDENLRAYAAVLKRELGKDVAGLRGSGAAGGLGAGAFSFLDAEMRQGTDVALDLVDFERIAPAYDLIITGEGKLDRQSLGGKVVVGIARRARAMGIPVTAVVGCVDCTQQELQQLHAEGIGRIFQTRDFAVSGEKDYQHDLYRTMLETI